MAGKHGSVSLVALHAGKAEEKDIGHEQDLLVFKGRRIAAGIAQRYKSVDGGLVVFHDKRREAVDGSIRKDGHSGTECVARRRQGSKSNRGVPQGKMGLGGLWDIYEPKLHVKDASDLKDCLGTEAVEHLLLEAAGFVVDWTQAVAWLRGDADTRRRRGAARVGRGVLGWRLVHVSAALAFRKDASTADRLALIALDTSGTTGGE